MTHLQCEFVTRIEFVTHLQLEFVARIDSVTNIQFDFVTCVEFVTFILRTRRHAYICAHILTAQRVHTNRKQNMYGKTHTHVHKHTLAHTCAHTHTHMHATHRCISKGLIYFPPTHTQLLYMYYAHNCEPKYRAHILPSYTYPTTIHVLCTQL